MAIRPIQDRDHREVLALNRDSVQFLSPMDEDRLRELRGFGGLHRVLEVDGEVVAFLIALDEGAAYDSENYRWFTRKRGGFVYVDRVVVSPRHRKRGYASLLYEALFEYARERGASEVVCEFNLEPVNEASRAFHTSRGFAEVGTREAVDRRLSMQSARTRT